MLQEEDTRNGNSFPSVAPALIKAQPLNMCFISSGTVDKKQLIFYDPTELAAEHDPFQNIENEPWADPSDKKVKPKEKIFLKPELVPTWESIRKRYASTLTDELSSEPARLPPAFKLNVKIKINGK